eukprot:CAMPEP_0172581108 /NCGR_PEP_ID=MMETSP1068-20121228/223_1 /TAXON_ID=35684 /ORGANISM="Pseudopedinella elastica, Strain CCMP716" /LENGTH=65 /DNA_ID=CAMNT_0013373939 /DNA_START=8 /DNA_END=203 /DNA_ORIENTATION=+
MSKRPSSEAHTRDVMPYWSFASTSAPASKSSVARAIWPFFEASSRDVMSRLIQIGTGFVLISDDS